MHIVQSPGGVARYLSMYLKYSDKTPRVRREDHADSSSPGRGRQYALSLP